MELTPGIQRRIRILFPEHHWDDAAKLLSERCKDFSLDNERIQCAILKNCGGILDRLPAAIETARIDFRDALVEAGFAWSLTAHQEWLPGEK